MGNTRIERPKKTWGEMIKNDMRKTNFSIEDANNGEKRRHSAEKWKMMSSHFCKQIEKSNLFLTVVVIRQYCFENSQCPCH